MQVGMWRRSIVRGTASSTDCERDRAFTDYDPESVIGIGAKVSPKQGTGLCGDGRHCSSGRALVEGRSNRTAETAAHGASNLHPPAGRARVYGRRIHGTALGARTEDTPGLKITEAVVPLDPEVAQEAGVDWGRLRVGRAG